MKNIIQAELVVSAPDESQWPESELPEVVLAGRSNVGKSTFINAICNRKKLAYVGNTPGKTRLLNFFVLNETMMLVDVPGYGYAAISKDQMIRFGSMMETYFEKREQLKGLVMIVDIRHKPTEDDITMLEFARYNSIPLCVIATKADKISYHKQLKQIEIIKQTLKLQESETLILFSSVTLKGLDAVWNKLSEFYEA